MVAAQRASLSSYHNMWWHYNINTCKIINCNAMFQMSQINYCPTFWWGVGQSSLSANVWPLQSGRWGQNDRIDNQMFTDMWYKFFKWLQNFVRTVYLSSITNTICSESVVICIHLLHVAIKSANSTFSCVRWQDVACRWFEIWQHFIEGFYHIKRTTCVWMYTCYMCIKTYTRVIRLYRTNTVSKDLNYANWVTLNVKLYSVMMNNPNTECE